MGRVLFPVYGEDLGSAIENAKSIIAKIETNKFDKEDINDLVSALEDIKAEIAKEDEE